MFRQRAQLFLMAICFVQPTTAQSADANRMIDLTHTFDEKTIYWPTEEGFKLLRGQRRHRARVTITLPTGSCAPSTAARTSMRRFISSRAGRRSTDSACSACWSGRVRRCVAEVCGRSRLSGDRRGFRSVGKGERASLEDRIVLIRTGFGRYLAGAAKISGHGRTRQRRRSPSCVSRSWIPRRPIGWSRGGGFAWSASTRPASTMARRRITRRTSGYSATTCRRSKMSPRWMTLPATASRSSRCR